jgi:hypothetical protein
LTNDQGDATYASHVLHDRELLGVDEALQRDADGHVDVVLTDVVPEVHASVGLGDADHAFNVTDGDRHTSGGL